ncbi:MAG: GAF domain-containing protein [Xanthobacteraceae bacterium]|jgi:signal transduction histidine kinase
MIVQPDNAAADPEQIIADLQRRLDESVAQQAATAEVMQLINASSGNLAPVFDAIVDKAMRLCDAGFGGLWVVEGDLARAAATRNLSDAYTEFLTRRPVLQAEAFGPKMKDQPVVHIADLAMTESYRQRAPITVASVELGGIRTYLAVPLRESGALAGVISMYRKEVRPFTDRQIVLVQGFAAQAEIAMTNARLFEAERQRSRELSESLEQQTATSEVLEVVSRSPGDLEPVFAAMLENAVRICDAKFGNIHRWDGDTAHLVATHKTPPAFAEARRRLSAFRPGPNTGIGRMVATKTVTQIVDLTAEPTYAVERVPAIVAAVELGGVRTFLAVPMLKENELIGAFTVYRQEVRPFTDKQIELVQNFAAQAVIAIENTRLLSELRESLQQQTATADVLKIISRSTFDLKTVLNTLVESAARLCEADMASIPRQTGAIFDHVATYGYDPAFQEFLQRNPISAGRGTVTGRAVLEGKTVHIPDVLNDPEYSFMEGQSVGGYRTALGVPLLREGNPIGVIVLVRREVRPFTDKQIELATSFADQAVIAIENVRLFEAEQQRTRELAKSLGDLRAAQDRLVQTEKLASLGQLTAGIAHEIKNPLNFVNNFSAVSVELIDELREALGGVHLDSKLRAEITEIADTLRGNLDKVVQHGKRADAIVKNMLLHSRQGSGEHRPVDINALVDESLNLAYHGARAEKQGFNITLERSFDPAAGEVDLFPQEITRALLNLISNGFYAATKRKAEANGGNYEPTLAATTKNLGDEVEIRIRDNGTGIPPEVREKLFNPFFTTKPAGEGTGLGLSISHDIIVKQHGGSIEVDTQPGEFTEFRIVLPRAGASLIKSGERM